MPYHKRDPGVYVAPHLVANVLAALEHHRRQHGYEPGMVWNPYAGWDAKTSRGGRYEWPQEGSNDAQATIS